MGWFEDQVTLAVYAFGFLLGETSPEDKDRVGAMGVDELDNGIGKLFPAFALVRAGLVGAYGEGGVEHQHTLVGPVADISCGGYLST